MEQPHTADGVNPLRTIRIDLPNQNPQTIADFMDWVQLRNGNLTRWIAMSEYALALETIARIEGDMQQLRHLLKASGATIPRVIEGTEG
jgi:hypothetical protein